MGWVMILLIWLVAPFAELGFIIVLAASNEKYKRQIRELEKTEADQDTLQETTKTEGWMRAGERPKVQEDRGTAWMPVRDAARPEREEKPVREQQHFPGRNLKTGLGTLALVMGVVFVVLAGLIFATTTWHILPDICKTFLVLACGVVFFGASCVAERVFHIRRTGNAFYILGSIFLFLSVLAAAYFRLLGADFILDGQNRWKVLWAGSIIALAAFWAGLKRFHDRIYTQSCLWGMSLNLFFMAKAISMGWSGFVCVMTVYSAVLVAVKAYGKHFAKQGEKKEWTALLEEGFCSFAPIHFWTFGAFSAFGGLFAVWRMMGEGCIGVANPFFDRFSLLSFTDSGMISMAALTGGIWILVHKEKKENCRSLLSLAAAESVLYGAGWITEDLIWRTAAVNLMFFLVLAVRYGKKEWFSKPRNLFLDICGAGAAVFTMVVFYSGGKGRTDGFWLLTAAFTAYHLWFRLEKRQWPDLLICGAALPIPLMAMLRLDLGFDETAAGTVAVLLLSGIAARRLGPVIEQDDRGEWRMDWFCILSVLELLWIYAMGDERWRFACILLAGLYFLQYHTVKSLRKAAFGLSACCAAAAFWQQPFVVWPQVLRLEMDLLPGVWLVWVSGRIWDKSVWVPRAQNAAYVLCLLLLCGDAVISGNVWDALWLEGICLTVFLWAQVKNHVWWVRISAGIILAVALFMTRDFWLSISWWVYLLAAGIGLIVFAGILEKKRR